MKSHFIFFLLLMSICKPSLAQGPTDKGVYSLSGFISYSETDSNNAGGKISLFSVHPGFLYFVSPGIAVGGSLGFSRSRSDGTDTDSYDIAPVFRYYFDTKEMYPFVSLGYGFGKAKSNSAGSNLKYDVETASASFGVDYFLSRNVSLEPSIGYSRTKYDFSTSIDYTQTDMHIAVGINVFIY